MRACAEPGPDGVTPPVNVGIQLDDLVDQVLQHAALGVVRHP